VSQSFQDLEFAQRRVESLFEFTLELCGEGVDVRQQCSRTGSSGGDGPAVGSASIYPASCDEGIFNCP
jgi:hypothetical protein